MYMKNNAKWLLLSKSQDGFVNWRSTLIRLELPFIFELQMYVYYESKLKIINKPIQIL